MTREELALEVSKTSGLSQKETLKVIVHAFDVIKQKLRTEKVVVTNFGAFETVEKAERTNLRNFKTGEPLKIPKRNAILFRPCGSLKDSVN